MVHLVDVTGALCNKLYVTGALCNKVYKGNAASLHQHSMSAFGLLVSVC